MITGIYENLEIKTIEIEQIRKVLLVKIQGYLDTYNSSCFYDFIKKLINRDYKYLVFDFKELHFIGSMGILSFLKLHKKIFIKNGEIYFVNISKKISEIFEQTGFNSFFKKIENIENVLKNIEQKKNNFNEY